MDPMAGGSGSSSTSEKQWVVDIRNGSSSTSAERKWVEDIRNTLKDADPSTEVEQWKKLSIYRVPECIKELNPKAYKPQLVSLGPFHHGDPNLLPMEEHKRRALLHLLRRAGKPLEEFWAAMEEVVEQLEGAYMDLGDEWRGSRDRFLKLMITDGCFLLEVMRAQRRLDDPFHLGDDDTNDCGDESNCGNDEPNGGVGPNGGGDDRNGGCGDIDDNDYAPNDPIFSTHGIRYTRSFIKRDMLIMENQIPLLVLERLLAVETGEPANERWINRMVLKSMSRDVPAAASGDELGLHPLDVYRKSLLYYHAPMMVPYAFQEGAPDVIPPAVVMYEAGIRFEKSSTESLRDILFQDDGVLRLPTVSVDDSMECMFLNLIAFERLHVGAGNDVTSYVFFMDNIIDSAKDVSLLTSKGIIQNLVGSEEAVANLFNSLRRDVVLEPGPELCRVHELVNHHCSKPWNKWRANLILTYFRSPWAFLSLAAAVFLLIMTVMQTLYSVLSYYK